MGEHIIIAGIAAEDEPILKKSLTKLGGVRKGNTLSFLTIKKKKPVYSKDVIQKSIDSLAITVSRKRPNALRVIYIQYPKSDILKELFFPFADTQSLDDVEYYQYVLNHFNIDQLNRKLLAVIRRGLKLRNRPAKTDYVMLPNKNFIFERKEFSELLYDYYFGCLDRDIFKDIKMNQNHNGYEDSRKLVFPVTKMDEGLLRYDESKMASKHFLDGIYRLGIEWNPGFHFDVRHSIRPTIPKCQFKCSINGDVEGNGATHVNIYLNDFVRLPGNKK
ncbi:hypothetical protein [Desulfobacter postgatei]|uniref:hypothetical protein n=1 Tax=Desulfobacter postgatei TaxID=2293 RepID=UPI00259BEF31|nr:hypothetical protein [uncultured Desulfobacter sp.]